MSQELAFETVIFDIDGTLLMAGGVGRRTMDAIVKEHLGVADSLRNVRLHGNTDPRIMEEVCRLHAGDQADSFLPVLKKEFLERMPRALAGNCTPIPGAREFLEWLLPRRVRLGIVTGNFETCARAKLETTGFLPFFSFLVTASDHPDRTGMLRIAMERTGSQPEKTLYVGDTPWDIEAAREAGCSCLAVPTSLYGMEDLVGCSPGFLSCTLSAMACDDWSFAFGGTH